MRASTWSPGSGFRRNRRDASGILELFDYHGANVVLQNEDSPLPPKPAAASHNIHPAAGLENTLRAWGASSLYYAIATVIGKCTPGQSPTWDTRRYVTLIQNRKIAALAACIHILPLTGTGGITWFVWNNYYVGAELAGLPRGREGTDELKLFGLQFAAKAHELLMVGSLTAIVFSLIRYEIARGRCLPIASLSAGLEVSKVSFLWSKEFVALCGAEFSTTGKKFLFLATILLCTLLSIAVAPASATALIPVLKNWEAGGTDMWLNTTSAKMFPEVLDDTHTLGPICAIADSNSECPSTGWRSISNEFLSRQTKVSAMTIDLSLINPGGFTGRGPRIAAPHVALAKAMDRTAQLWSEAAYKAWDTLHKKKYNKWEHVFRFLRFRVSETFTLKSLSPMAFTICHEMIPNPNGVIVPVLPDLKYVPFKTWSLDYNFYQTPVPSTPDISINLTAVEDWISSAVTNTSRPGLFWFDSPLAISDVTSIGAVISLPVQSQGVSSGVQIWGCAIDARWANLTIDSVRGEKQAWLQWPHRWRGWPEGQNWTPSHYPQAKIRPSFAQYLNPVLRSSNSTVFQEMATSGGLWGSNVEHMANTAGFLGTILTSMIVNGMARTSPYTAQQGEVIGYHDDSNDWWRGFMPPGQVFGPGNNAFDISEDEKKSFLRIKLNAYVEGYGYSKSSTAMSLAIIVLLVQLSVTILFLIVSISTGTTSTSWDTTSELIALALNSPPPETTESTSAGVTTITSLKEKYCISVDGTKLQLIRRDDNVPLEERVKPGRVYD